MIHYLLKLNTFVEILELLPQIRSTWGFSEYYMPYPASDLAVTLIDGALNRTKSMYSVQRHTIGEKDKPPIIAPNRFAHVNCKNRTLLYGGRNVPYDCGQHPLLRYVQ